MGRGGLVAAILEAAELGAGATFCRFFRDGEVDGEVVARRFDEFVERAQRLAAGLQEAGAAGERVLLLFPPGVDFAEAFVACVLAGAVAVPVPPPDPRRLERTIARLERTAADARARFVLASAEFCAMVPALAAMAPELARREWLASETYVDCGARWRGPADGPGAIAYLQYTSGSTGEPKGVCVTHGNLLHNTANIAAAFGANRHSAGVIWLPPYHDMGLIGGILQPLLRAFPVVWMSPLDFLRRPARWLRALAATRATISGGPDFAYALCARKVEARELEGVDLSSWEVAFSGAEPVRPETLAAFARRFAPLGFRPRAFYPTYGLAESTLIVTGGRAGAGPRGLEVDAEALARGEVRAGPGRTVIGAGAALAGMDVRVVDPGTLAETTSVGEIWVAGPSVAAGYWHKPEATREVFDARTAEGRGPFLRTGDLGFLEGGELFVVGRQKDVVIVRGRNVHPGDVEAAISGAHPAIRPGGIAVFRVEHAGEERAAAAVEVDPERLGDGADAVIDAVRRAASERAEVALAGVVLWPAGTVPKTTSGKVQRFRARELFGEPQAPALGRWSEAVAVGPAPGAIEGVRRRLVAAIAPFLGVAPERIEGQRAFDAYGVDSARLVEMSEAVERVFGRAIPPSALYNHPNLDALARFLAEAEATTTAVASEASAAREASTPAPLYRGGGETLGRLDRRGLGYRFDLAADVPWGRLDEPGVLVPEALAEALGVDVAGLKAGGAWAVGEWGLALEFCVGFEALERALILACARVQATTGPARSLELLVEEEDKHILLFRRLERWLRGQRPAEAAIFDGLAISWRARRGADWLVFEGAEAHLRWWLWTLLFEAWTVFVHEALTRSPAEVQPVWLAAHAMHRREEAQHLATDLAFVEALELDEAARRRVAAAFLLELLELWPEFFAVTATHGLCRARFPGLALAEPDPVPCAQRLLGERSFTSLLRAAPGLAEVLARPAAEVRAAAQAAARGEAFVAAAEPAVAAPPADPGRAEDVAIVGFGCRLPGDVGSIEGLWERLLAGFDAITEVPPERWDIDAWFDADPRAPGRMYTRWGGFLRGVEEFDAPFFGVSPREARSMDPQQRVLLEVTWEALEHAGIPPASLAGSRAGVWVGICAWDYSRRNNDTLQDAWSATGNALSVAAGRISYTLGLRGPSMAIDTACSSSLVAVHLAVQSLRRGESELAIVGGVNLLLSPLSTVCFSALRAMSPVGRCKTFDASADGYVRSEGCGVVVLKRLADARRAGDRVLAVIRGTAVNQDGRSNGLTAPHGPAQEEVIRAALADAGLGPEDLDYLEAHGTGTGLGDPIELGAIAGVMAGRAAERPIWVGSVKTNLGHGEGASGIAGLAKAVMIARHRTIPMNLHFVTPTPRVAWAEIPVRVPTTAVPLSRPGRPRVGINSFGFGGTNAHAVIEGAAEFEGIEEGPAPILVLPISAPSAEGLRALAGRLADHVEAHPEEALADVCATMACGRNAWPVRAALVVGDRAALCADLRALASGAAPTAAAISPAEGASEGPRVAFLFTGQGAQAPGMARGLHAALPAFRAAFDEARAELDRWLERPIAPVIFGEAGAAIHETGHAQPALFAVEWALAQAWRALGVEPCGLLGHSIGELTAACVAGVLSLADAARLVCARGRLMQSLPRGGAMASLEADEATVSEALGERLEEVDVAAVNGPRQIVISGDEGAVEAVLRELAARGVRGRRLTVSHAFHSPRMEPILDAFEAEARRAALRRPRTPLISNLTGRTAGADVARAGYWALHVRAPVRFADGLATLVKAQRPDVLVEIGPAPVLAGLCAQIQGVPAVVPSLRPGREDPAVFAAALAHLWAAGVKIEWRALYGRRRRLSLPTTPMQRARHWIEASARGAVTGAGPATPWLGARLDVAGPAIFAATIDEAARAWLGDHRVGERVLVPFTGLCQLARLAAIEAGSEAALRDVVVEAPLAVEAEGAQRVQVTAEEGRVRVDARAASGWRRHLRARCERGDEAPAAVDLAALAGRCGEAIEAAAIYAALAESGLAYGPCFKGLVGARVGRGEVLAEIRAPAALAGQPAAIQEVALVDAALQAAGLLLADAGGLHLPVGAEAVEWGPLPERFWVHGTGQVGARARVDLTLIAAGGAVIGRIRGLTLQRAGRSKGEEAPGTDALWTVEARPVGAPSPGPARALIVGDGPLARALARRMAEGTEIAADPAGVAARLAAGRWTAVVSLLGLGGAALATSAAVVRAASARPGVRVVLVTRGADAAAPEQAGLWGMARSAANELAGTPIRIVDVDPASDDGAAAAALALEVGDDPETQVLWRGGERLALRLAPLVEEALARPEGPARLRVDREGGLVRLEAAPSREPGPGEVAIAVEYAGLNFRDVLGALGRYPGEVGPLGGECCGRVIAVGPGVEAPAIGERVMALAPASFADVAITDARMAVPVPAGMTSEEAATVPIAFATAWYALHELGRVRAGERVLIHAAAGGVGMAAVQIAQAIGAEVFATASPGKWATVEAMGVRGPLSSRDTSFAAAIRARTGGEGVDVVLNSLTGAILEESVRLLRSGGRFLEMGKAEIWEPARVAAVNPRASYVAFDLAVQDPATLGGILRRVAEGLAAGVLRPLPSRVFPLGRAPAAFREMAAARHVGKVLLQVPRELPLDPEGAYVVTGGTGALGGHVARWLVERGARRIVLAGRRAPEEALVADLEAEGAKVRAVAVDLADEGGARALVTAARAFAPRLRGIVHAAGVVADAPLAGLDADAFARVLAPKARAAIELSEATRGDPIHLFVLFGSVSGVLGGAGQANYAAANAILDALARSRRAAGRPALAIDWGPWEGEGMAGRLDPALRRRLLAQGMSALAPGRALRLMDEALRSSAAQVVIAPLDRRALAARFAGGTVPRILAEIVAGEAGAQAPAQGLREAIAAAPPGERHARLVAALREAAAQVLGARPSAVDPRRALSDLGLDSLMAVDLVNSISGALRVRLEATALLEHPNLEALARHLAGLLEPSPGETEVVAAAGETEAARRLRAEIEALEGVMA